MHSKHIGDCIQESKDNNGKMLALKYTFQKYNVTVLSNGNEPLFDPKDIAKIIGIKNFHKPMKNYWIITQKNKTFPLHSNKLGKWYYDKKLALRKGKLGQNQIDIFEKHFGDDWNKTN